MSAEIIPFRKPTKRERRSQKPKPELAYCADRVTAGTQDPDLGDKSDRQPDTDQ